MDTVSSDCLVLKIEEHVDGELDTTLFILYDNNEETYLVRGKRSNVFGKPETVPYSFYCNYASDLIDFINFVICKKSRISYTLSNYDDLPNNVDEIDYQYLKELDGDIAYELAGYDNQKYNKKEILKLLRVLRNVFNYY
jgi:hypothetical protein